ncbi:hypothetical protein K0U07_02355 [bacterium]|nr:hypothetical protein [bacterium]
MFFAGLNFCVRQALSYAKVDQATQREVNHNIRHAQNTTNRLSVMGATVGPSIGSAITRAAPLFKGIGKIAFLPLSSLFFWMMGKNKT